MELTGPDLPIGEHFNAGAKGVASLRSFQPAIAIGNGTNKCDNPGRSAHAVVDNPLVLMELHLVFPSDGELPEYSQTLHLAVDVAGAVKFGTALLVTAGASKQYADDFPDEGTLT